ncbi:hypothetical protein DYB31_013820, partial [Aphanomyces astaci]
LERYVEISNVVADGKFQDILAKAKASPKPQRLAYYFGSHDFGLHKATQVKPWLHSQHLAYTKGFPSRACSDDQTALLLSHAVREATPGLNTRATQEVAWRIGQIEPWNGANHDAYLYQTWLDDEDLDGVALGVEDAEAFVASNSARPYESESENARISADKGDVWDDMGDDEIYSNESGSDVDIAEPPLFPHNAVKVVEVATSSTPPTDELRSPIEPKLDLDIAKTNQDVFKLVYFFGRHDLYEFLATSAVTRVLPYMVPSDLDPDVTEPEVPLLPKESIVWALTKDHPWMPGYLCDPWSSPKKLASCRLPIVTND